MNAHSQKRRKCFFYHWPMHDLGPILSLYLLCAFCLFLFVFCFIRSYFRAMLMKLFYIKKKKKQLQAGESMRNNLLLTQMRRIKKKKKKTTTSSEKETEAPAYMLCCLVRGCLQHSRNRAFRTIQSN